MKKNNKGFTLVELVAVIAILLTLATIAAVAVTGVMKKSDQDTKKVNEKQIISAAKNYVIDNINNFNSTASPLQVSELINKGYLESDNSTGTLCVTIEDNGKTNITYSSETITTCSQESGEI